MHLQVHAEITAIGILEHIRRELGMIEGGIENLALRPLAGIVLIDFHLYAAQSLAS